jgi:hypothetical protein
MLNLPLIRLEGNCRLKKGRMEAGAIFALIVEQTKIKLNRPSLSQLNKVLIISRKV